MKEYGARHTFSALLARSMVITALGVRRNWKLEERMEFVMITLEGSVEVALGAVVVVDGEERNASDVVCWDICPMIALLQARAHMSGDVVRWGIGWLQRWRHGKSCEVPP